MADGEGTGEGAGQGGGEGGPAPLDLSGHDWATVRGALAGDNEDLAKSLEGFDDFGSLASRATQETDWRKAIAGDDEDRYKALEAFSAPGDFDKEFRRMQTAMRQGGQVKIPGEGATDDEIRAFQVAAGIPASADGYEITYEAPEGLLGEEDTAFLSAVVEDMHKRGDFVATPQAVNFAHEMYAKAVEVRNQAQEEYAAGARDRAMADLKKSWQGSDYKANMQFSEGAAAFYAERGGFAEPEDMFNIPIMDETGKMIPMGADPRIIKMFAAIARDSGNVGVMNRMDSGANAGKSVDERIAEIRALANGNSVQKAEYDKLAAKGGELDTLYARRVAMKERAA